MFPHCPALYCILVVLLVVTAYFGQINNDDDDDDDDDDENHRIRHINNSNSIHGLLLCFTATFGC